MPAQTTGVSKLSCVIIEDQTLFTQLLVAMLRTQDAVEVVGTAATVAEGIRVCDKCKPDLLILDLALPDDSGLVAARHLAIQNPAAKIIILSGEASTFVCPPGLDTFIHAVVDKTSAYNTLGREIANLAGSTRKHSSAPRRAESDPGSVLSKRELEIFSNIGLGLTSKQIAAKLFISFYTVETHRKNISTKTGLSGAELVRAATLYNHTLLN